MRDVIGLAVAASIVVSGAAAAQTASEKNMLMKLEPNTRLAQACDLSALQMFMRDKVLPKVDRVVIGALAPPAVEGDTARGTGGAVRSAGRWHSFSFTCVLTKDRLKATAFSYRLGREIPKQQWEKFNLW